MSSRSYLSAALRALACTLPTLSFAASDTSSLYDQALKAQNGDAGAIDLKTAQDLLEKAAAAGSTTAMQRLGDMYHDGDGGVKKDFAQAIEWYKKEADFDAAHPGTGALGLLALGEMYDKGKGVEQDRAKANDYFNKALASARTGANKGDTASMVALAYLLAQGKGDPGKVDTVQAWAWALKASQTPSLWASELLASFYNEGVGIKPDESKALANSLKAAQFGSTREMVAVSLCFATGKGVKKDERIALEWVRKAADRGSSRAMSVLGKYYNTGLGLERSDLTAKEWFQKAIDAGDETAFGFMGETFIAPGVNPRDAKSAAACFEKGAKADDPYSMFQLAKLLAYDPDLNPAANAGAAFNNPNISRATELLTRAAALGYIDAMAAMGELYEDRRLAGTQDDAIAWFRKAAAAGSAMGMRDLGESLTIQATNSTAYGVNDDNKPLMAEAFDWLKKAADSGDVEALADIGDAYQYGKGPATNASSAINWYRKGANAGNVRAMRSLGFLFMTNPILTDYAEAKKWFEKAIAQGDVPSLSGLAELYDNGWGVTADNNTAQTLYRRAIAAGDAGGYRGAAEDLRLKGDLPKAAAYFQRAGELGDVRAMETLGRMYELGQGVEKNINLAMLWMRRANNLGSATAWNWIFSHTIITTAPGTATRGAMPTRSDLTDLPDLPPAGGTPSRSGRMGRGMGPGGFGAPNGRGQ
jgi:TPR repeat protein